MNKKHVTLLMTVFFILATAAGSLAVTIADLPCGDKAIGEGQDRYIECEICSWAGGKGTGGAWLCGKIQYQHCPTQAAPGPNPMAFDSERHIANNPALNYLGYCLTNNTPSRSYDGYIFDVCCCDEACDVFGNLANREWSLRIDIVDCNDMPIPGVYWTDTNVSLGMDNKVGIRYYKETNDFCTRPNHYDPNHVAIGTFPAPQDMDEDPNPAVPAVDWDDNGDKTYTPNEEYIDVYDYTGLGFFPKTKLDANYQYDCFDTVYSQTLITKPNVFWPENIPAGIRAKDRQVLLIDVPTFVYDPDLIEAGAEVTIRVQLKELGDCADCPAYCTQYYCVGVFGCGAVYDYCALCLPYVTAGADSWTGIALSNMQAANGDYTITFFSNGVEAYFSSEMDGMSTTTISVTNLTDNLMGQAPSLDMNNMFAQVWATFPVDGFVLVGDPDEARGYLPRKGLCGGCCDTVVNCP